MSSKELGIYVHIPFCVKKCYYCDFISFANKKEIVKEYINAIKKEIQTVGAGLAFDQSEELIVNSEYCKEVGAGPRVRPRNNRQR